MEGKATTIATILIMCSILSSLASAKNNDNKLLIGFYDLTCPRAEQIVAEVVADAYRKDPGNAAGLLRLFFHDCFVNGCDASLLLDATPSGEQTEKESGANLGSLRGLEIIDEAKSRLEAECPGIVSCADTLAFATRDGSVLAGVPRFHVAAGRRDGLVSRADDVPGNIAGPTSPTQQLTQIFVRKGLSLEDMVVLIGAHSIGVAHCPTFAYRARGYNQTLDKDPKLSESDSANIAAACGRLSTPEEQAEAFLPFDTVTPFKMDSVFYKHLLEGKGLLESDIGLAGDSRTKPVVEAMASNEKMWLEKFRKAMVRLGKVDVKTGTEGEIRKRCRFVNSGDDADSGEPVESTDTVDSGDTSDSGNNSDSDSDNSSNWGNNSDFDSDSDSGSNSDSHSRDKVGFFGIPRLFTMFWSSKQRN
ncbi:peroxidase [Sarracenia purpurea var. burkii]